MLVEVGVDEVVDGGRRPGMRVGHGETLSPTPVTDGDRIS